MKKLVSLLLTLALLCCSIVPALAETTAPVITVAEFQTAMTQLAKNYIGWDMEWTSDGMFITGNMAANPALLTNGDYVTMCMVSFTAGPEDDSETITNLFIITSALAAAAPAVRDGMDFTAATDAIWSDLQTMFGSLTETSTSAFGTLYGANAMVMLSETEDGSVDMSLLLLYTDPNAE